MQPSATTAAPSRRQLALGLGALGLAAPGIARGAGFPERPLRLINPWSPGSSSDVQMRSLAELGQRSLGQPVIVENRPGASGTLHALSLAREARPDGYTLGQMHLSVVRRPFLVRNPQWDVTKDFTYIIGLCGWVTGLAVRADSPWQTFQEFMESAKTSPGGRTYATSGIATTPHIAMEDMARRLGVPLTHVPYRGTSEGVTAVLSGTVDCMADASAWAPQVVAGRMRLLAVFTPERFARFPEVPTLREIGLDMVVSTAYGLAGPAGIDRGVVRVLHDAFREALFHPENERVRAQFDMPAEYRDSEQYRELILRQAEYEKAMVQRLGLRLD